MSSKKSPFDITDPRFWLFAGGDIAMSWLVSYIDNTKAYWDMVNDMTKDEAKVARAMIADYLALNRVRVDQLPEEISEIARRVNEVYQRKKC